jgi:hypothetical protein
VAARAQQIQVFSAGSKSSLEIRNNSLFLAIFHSINHHHNSMSVDSSYQEPIRVSEIADDMYADVVKHEDVFDLSGFIGSLPKGVLGV